MAAQYIFQMQGLTKAYPGNRKVFENIWLSFYPDAIAAPFRVGCQGRGAGVAGLAGRRNGGPFTDVGVAYCRCRPRASPTPKVRSSQG